MTFVVVCGELVSSSVEVCVGPDEGSFVGIIVVTSNNVGIGVGCTSESEQIVSTLSRSKITHRESQ